jgi:hypothetical protein
MRFFMIPSLGGGYWKTFFPAIRAWNRHGSERGVAYDDSINSVPGQHARIASGINNAVSRTAVLGVAIFGIIMVHSFNGEVNRRLARLELPTSARSAMDQQRAWFARAEIPSSIEGDTRFAVTQMINESFIFGFRVLMFVAAGLALVSALVAFKLIENN